MGCYDALAVLYDRLVEGVDFAGWADYVEEIVGYFHQPAAHVVDLACGTGNTLIPLAARGLQATGVDICAAMLAVAAAKARRLGLDLELLEQDMRHFSLPRPVDLVTCFHDGLNYLPTLGDLTQTFVRVREVLKPGGLFIFDLNTLQWLAPQHGREAAGPDEVVLEEADFGLTWRTGYDPDRHSWEIDLSGWVLQNGDKVRFQERHQEWAYNPVEVTAALRAGGLEDLACYHPFTLRPAAGDSRRHFYVARRPR